MGNLSKRSLTIDWIFPVDNKYNFRQLEIEYRKILINDNKLVKGVLDSSLVLDIRCEQGILHHQSGAMRISQLQDEYRAFKTREGHPMIFLFLQTDVENRQLMTYSKKDIEDFMRKSYEVCKSHTTRFKKIMGAVL